MMEKLELKHLAPYLPYGLRLYCRSSNKKIQDLSYDKLSDGKIEHMNKWEHKLILRPLSNLINNEFEKELGYFTPDFKFNLDSTEYKFIERMLKLHFDVFGLIEKGLAIDKNKLAQLK